MVPCALPRYADQMTGAWTGEWEGSDAPIVMRGEAFRGSWICWAWCSVAVSERGSRDEPVGCGGPHRQIRPNRPGDITGFLIPLCSSAFVNQSAYAPSVVET